MILVVVYVFCTRNATSRMLLEVWVQFPCMAFEMMSNDLTLRSSIE